ncbi:ATP-dependent DNA helicase RecQ [Spirochaetia bacterium]|nr:ATP-dependent DNA helicase RecQ [Spirochaetia bacterium]GHU32789.1 ATP-dependent DNA helicase RecQ [Spirochaetia bacterium]
MHDSIDPVTAAAAQLFGLSYLFPYQRLVVANILEAAQAASIPVVWPDSLPMDPYKPEDPDDRESLGRQMVILPTGAGKSLCFQLPALLLGGATLVIYPILSLMADQERRLQERGFSPVLLRGGQSEEERIRIFEQIRSGTSRFIIANPEILLTRHVFEQLPTLNIVHMVIDEAHCVSEWGESFRPSYLEIGRIVQASGSQLVTAFTATASAPVLEKIDSYIFADHPARRIIGNPDRSNIKYESCGCILPDLGVRDLLITHERPAIVFCSSRLRTEELAQYLRDELEEPELRFYHAGLEREEKTAVEKWFFESKTGILVATCAYGMGVDKADIRTVIHRDCPLSVESYLQESGRAGRDGKAAHAILLWGPVDAGLLARAPNEMDKIQLQKMLNYARDTGTCRREALLSLLDYDGENQRVPESDCCDVCAKSARPRLREEASLYAFFRKNPFRYQLSEAAQCVAQESALKWSVEDAKQAIKYLLNTNVLYKIRFPLWKGKIFAGKYPKL